ncbi:MAG: antibiotic biosynthesis monooxygenase family protein [Thermodesulfobacteriota bacterium]
MSITVIFRVEIKEGKEEEYRKISAEVLEVAKEHKGLISMERAKSVLKERTYISISEWESEEAIERWVRNPKHQEAMRRGKEDLFSWYSVKRMAEIKGGIK